MQRKNTNSKWCFIINPTASDGEVGRVWGWISDQLTAKGVLFEALFTERKMHAAELAKQTIESGIRHLIAVGGDGTAHEVVNGIFQQQACPPAEVTFCLLPIGTGNDWVKTHRIPRKFHRWLDSFLRGNTSFQDVGEMVFYKNKTSEKRYFINVAGLSYDGYVAQKAEGRTATFFKAFFYLEMTARCLFGYRIPRLSVEANGNKTTGQLLTVQVGICRYSGGGMQLVPHAQPADGLLALTIAGKINPLAVLLISPLFYFGKIGWHPKVHFTQTKQVSIKPMPGETVLAEADGEFLGEAPADISILPNALQVVLP